MGPVADYYDNIEKELLDLDAGRVDLIVSQGVSVHEWLQKNPNTQIEVKTAPFKNYKYMGKGAGIAVRKEDAQSLIPKINEAIQKMFQNGRYQSINQKYFPFSINPNDQKF